MGTTSTTFCTGLSLTLNVDSPWFLYVTTILWTLLSELDFKTQVTLPSTLSSSPVPPPQQTKIYKFAATRQAPWKWLLAVSTSARKLLCFLLENLNSLITNHGVRSVPRREAETKSSPCSAARSNISDCGLWQGLTATPPVSRLSHRRTVIYQNPKMVSTINILSLLFRPLLDRNISHLLVRMSAIVKIRGVFGSLCNVLKPVTVGKTHGLGN